jgi:hypothetical protein
VPAGAVDDELTGLEKQRDRVDALDARSPGQSIRKISCSAAAGRV